MTPRPRALVIAYACEPGRGSEPGAGWGLVRALSRFADCVVLVGPEHADALAHWTRAHPGEPIEFVSVPERGWPARATRGRLGWFVAYLRWLPAARRTALALHASQAFDVAWHATYAVYWLPSPIHTLGIPSVWGPVGGAVTPPPSLSSVLGFRGELSALADRVAVAGMAMLPAARATAHGAAVVLVQNDATRARLPARLRTSALVLNHALFVETEHRAASVRGRRILLASSLEKRKGVALALRALALAGSDIELTIAGDGPDRAALERLVRDLGLSARVRFAGAIPRTSLQALYDASAAVVFTGLYEEGGLALAEAMYAGAHVIVLDHGGAGAIARTGTDKRRVTLVQAGSLNDTVQNLASAMTRAVATVQTTNEPTIDQAAALASLRSVLHSAIAPRASTRAVHARADADAFDESVTVVIPAFNAARYLRSAALSVLAQSHRALTLVIVNDGSTDETRGIAEQIASADARVRVVSTTNGGRARARNLGARVAPGASYIAFLDADDLWDPCKLTEQLYALRVRPDAAGVGSFMRYVSSHDRVLGETGQAISEADAVQISRGELAPFPISSCLLMRATVFTDMNGFDEELREAEDLDFIARLARRGAILTVERPLGSYRIHPDSAMARSRGRVNMFARFVRRRLRERDAGRDLHWSTFEASYHPSWRERRRDAVEIWYRSAALWRGEEQLLRAAGYAALATLAAPAYTARRALRQWMLTVG